MQHFCLYDHPDMPLVRAVVVPRPRSVDRDGFRLRYSAELGPDAAGHADGIIDMLDDGMGARTKAHGVYQARYPEVRAAYDAILATDPSPGGQHSIHEVLRPLALLLGVALAAVTCVALPLAIVTWLGISALKRHRGLTAVAEAAIVWSIFDLRPYCHRLFRYWRYGK